MLPRGYEVRTYVVFCIFVPAAEDESTAGRRTTATTTVSSTRVRFLTHHLNRVLYVVFVVVAFDKKLLMVGSSARLILCIGPASAAAQAAACVRGPLIILKPLLWGEGGGGEALRGITFLGRCCFFDAGDTSFFLNSLLQHLRGGVGPLPVKATDCISLLAVLFSFLLLQRAPMISAFEAAKCCYEQYKGQLRISIWNIEFATSYLDPLGAVRGLLTLCPIKEEHPINLPKATRITPYRGLPGRTPDPSNAMHLQQQHCLLQALLPYYHTYTHTHQ